MPFRRTSDGVTAFVRVTPRAARDRISGCAATLGGGREIRIGVTAAPEAGKANAAVLKLLAKAWKLPKSSLTIVRGDTDRRKTVLATGDSDALSTSLAAWLKTIETQE